jgi:hypothetical protein
MHGTRETARAHSELHAKSHRRSKRPPFECIALLLQGAARYAPVKPVSRWASCWLRPCRVAVPGADTVTPNFLRSLVT